MDEHISTTRGVMISFEEQENKLQLLSEFVNRILKKTLDYGVIPGTSKPTLFKPGAEKLLKAFDLSVHLSTAKDYMDNGHREYVSTCTLSHSDSGSVVATAEGSCCTMEKKYLHTKNIADIYNTCLKMACKRAMIAAVLIGTGASSLFTQDNEDFSAKGTKNTGGYQTGNKSYEKFTCPFCHADAVGVSKFSSGNSHYCYPKSGGCGRGVNDKDLRGNKSSKDDSGGVVDQPKNGIEVWVDSEQPPDP